MLHINTSIRHTSSPHCPPTGHWPNSGKYLCWLSFGDVWSTYPVLCYMCCLCWCGRFDMLFRALHRMSRSRRVSYLSLTQLAGCAFGKLLFDVNAWGATGFRVSVWYVKSYFIHLQYEYVHFMTGCWKSLSANDGISWLDCFMSMFCLVADTFWLFLCLGVTLCRFS